MVIAKCVSFERRTKRMGEIPRVDFDLQQNDLRIKIETGMTNTDLSIDSQCLHDNFELHKLYTANTYEIYSVDNIPFNVCKTTLQICSG